MFRSGRLAACAAAVALLAPAAVTEADGGAKSRIKMSKLSHSGAKGKVTSQRDRCVGGRKVSLFVIENFVSDKLQITHTKSNGRWRIRRNLDPGRYFAKVDGRRGCRFDNSRVKTLR
ncbi:MAG: hypothetical protein ACRDK9_10770 [Solirubrobacterales bacterium]